VDWIPWASKLLIIKFSHEKKPVVVSLSLYIEKKSGETAKKTGQEFQIGDLIRKICQRYGKRFLI
jgi:hypothetical protein